MKNLCPLLVFTMLLVACNQEDDQLTPTPVDNTPTVEQISFGNGSFEEGTGIYPQKWWNRVDGFTLERTAKAAWSGRHSVFIATDTPQPDFCFWGQTFTDFTHGKGLKMSVKVKTEAVEGGGCSLVIRGDDTASPEGLAEYFYSTQDAQFIGATQDWTTYELEADAPIGENIQSITVYLVFFANTTGKAWFDQVEIWSSEVEK